MHTTFAYKYHHFEKLLSRITLIRFKWCITTTSYSVKFYKHTVKGSVSVLIFQKPYLDKTVHLNGAWHSLLFKFEMLI